MQVIVKPIVDEQLFETARYISQSQPRAAERIVQQFEQHCEELKMMPRCGSLQNQRFASGREVRRLPIHGFADYGIFYEVQEDQVVVFAVIHGASLRR
jgi:plasmid stabilization system protein ParE